MRRNAAQGSPFAPAQLRFSVDVRSGQSAGSQLRLAYTLLDEQELLRETGNTVEASKDVEKPESLTPA